MTREERRACWIEEVALAWLHCIPEDRQEDFLAHLRAVGEKIGEDRHAR